MPANTPRLALPYPVGSDPPDGAGQMQSLATQLDSLVASDQQGTLAARPAPGTRGRYYFATDAQSLYRDDGSAWKPVGADVGDLKFSARVNEYGGWIKADGRTLSAGMFSALRDALVADGSPYGNASGNPLLPDMNGRAAVGAGTAAGAAGATAHTVGQKDGHETHTLTVAQVPAHAHLSTAQLGMISDSGVFTGYQLPTGSSGRQVDGVGTNTIGGGQAHTNMPPYTVGQWFIYAGSAT